MVVSVCGDVDPDETAEYIETLLQKIVPTPNIKMIFPEEPEETGTSYITQELDVSIPVFNIGYKNNNVGLSDKAYAEFSCIGKLALEIMFGKSSEFYNNMYTKGYINDSFGTEFSCEKQFVNSIISGEANNIEELTEEVQKTIDFFSENGIEEIDFNRHLKKLKSSYIKLFNNPESVARMAMECHFNKHNILEHSEIINGISKIKVEEFIKTMTKDKRVVSVILPKNSVN